MPLNSHIGQLIIKQLQGTITAEEARALRQWIAADDKNRIHFEKLTSSDWLQQAVSDHAVSESRIKERVFAALPELQDTTTGSPKRGWIRWMSVAAAVLIIVSIGWYVWQGKTKPAIVAEQQTPVATVIPAGGNKATLTLADGTVIDLDKAGNGTIATEGKTTVNKKEDGQLEYKSATSTKQAAITYNLLTTPRGGQYQLLLPDGSKVWLNAASSIKYPTAFAGNERRVEVSGELYFEVKSDASKPFKVTIDSRGGEITVVGTKFNVNAYEDEGISKTTLLEGKIHFNSNRSEISIKPGQQVWLNKEAETLEKQDNVDVDEVVAWRNGYFQFNNADLKTVLRQLSRWYDVDVQYNGEIATREFVGTIPRSLNLSKVLTLLQNQDVHFKIDGKNILVSP
jgi:ferric-dicitrate binding protein FerR (iron transport regulator)